MDDTNTQTKTLAEVFGLDSEVMIPIRTYGAEEQGLASYVPRVDPHYKFRKELVQILLYWLFGREQQNLFLHGPTGAGKSSLVEQGAARLGLPVFKVSCHARTEYPEFTGLYIKGGHEFCEGPLTKAMKAGGIFLMDEGDQLNPSAAMGTNAALDGKSILVVETGEVIEPHPNFRIAITGNSAGSGDRARIYKGVTAQNPAWLDRSMSVIIDYMSPEEEVAVIRAAVPTMDACYSEAMIRVANEVRDLFKGVQETGMNHTISTRTLVRWAQMSVAFADSTAQPVMDALKPAFLNRLDPDQARAVEGICSRVFGRNV
ncbi:AAA family ATPase [Thiomonas sp.]